MKLGDDILPQRYSLKVLIRPQQICESVLSENDNHVTKWILVYMRPNYQLLLPGSRELLQLEKL